MLDNLLSLPDTKVLKVLQLYEQKDNKIMTKYVGRFLAYYQSWSHCSECPQLDSAAAHVHLSGWGR